MHLHQVRFTRNAFCGETTRIVEYVLTIAHGQ